MFTHNERQEIYDQVVGLLMDQGCQSRDWSKPSSMCRYRTPSGLKCGIGHLITDEEYDPSFEGVAVSGLCSDNILDQDNADTGKPNKIDRAKRGGWALNKPFMEGLQQAHDYSSDGKTFIQMYTSFGRKWGLNVPDMSTMYDTWNKVRR